MAQAQFRLTTQEIQSDQIAFGQLVYGLYLLIFTARSSGDAGTRTSLSPIFPYIQRTITTAHQQLGRSALASVRSTSRELESVTLTISEQKGWATGSAGQRLLFTRCVMGLLMRLGVTCPKVTSLAKWTILAYGEPNAETPMNLLSPVILPDASLDWADAGLSVSWNINWIGLPSFWRWLYVITTGFDVDQNLDLQNLLVHITRHSLLMPAKADNSSDALPLPNALNILLAIDAVWGQADRWGQVDFNIMHSDQSTYRFLNNSRPYLKICGSSFFWPWFHQTSNLASYLQKRPGVWYGLHDGMSATTDKFVDLTYPSAGYVPTLGIEALGDNLDASGDDASSKPDALDQHLRKPSDDDQTSDEPDAYNPDDEDDSALPKDTSVLGDDKNSIYSMGVKSSHDSIDLIDLSTSADSAINTYLYRASVLALNNSLQQNADLDVSVDTRTALQTWCSRWLFLAHPDQTQKLVRELGLQSLLKPVSF